MVEALLFDLDGTLVDSAEGIRRALNRAAATVGGKSFSREDIRHFMGSPLEEVLADRFGYDRATALLVRERFLPLYRADGLSATTAAPGMAELVRRLKAAGFRLAVASCKPWVLCGPTLELCGFSGCFEAVVGSGHNGVPEEKDAVIREALRLLDVPREAALMIGDRAVDVLGAAACGLPCVGVDFCGYAQPGELEGAGALAVFHTAAGLERFLTAPA